MEFSGFQGTVQGVALQFPHKPYPAQMLMMSNVIRALNRGENGLLESPTGTGKSLSLLCSALAWQDHAKQQLKASLEEAVGRSSSSDKPSDSRSSLATPATSAACESRYFAGDQSERAEKRSDSDDDDDFVKPQQPTRRKLIRKPESQSTPGSLDGNVVVITDDAESDDGTARATVPPLEEDPPHIALQQSKLQKFAMELSGSDSSAAEVSKPNPQPDFADVLAGLKPKKPKAPKIFFGTRTHKQIAQLIREFKKTKYCERKMTVLSSRDHTCINTLAPAGKKNEFCSNANKSQNEHEKCSFRPKADLLTKLYSRTRGAWDIEDLVKDGNSMRGCPYYAARDLMETADIVFCPYNYLLDPTIRSKFRIALEGHIVILDEAHNIEDVARESVSIDVTSPMMEALQQDLEKVIKYAPVYANLNGFIGAMGRWMADCSKTLPQDSFESSSKVWKSAQAAVEFEKFGMTPATLEIYDLALAELMADDDSENDDQSTSGPKFKPTLTATNGALLQSMLSCFRTFFTSLSEDAYRVVLVRRPEEVVEKRQTIRNMITTLGIWCMSPKIGFKNFSDPTHSVILASGTLSPMESFASELGVDFPIRMEGSHVIDPCQILVQTIGRNPEGQEITATFHHVDTLRFQDQLGDIIAGVCDSVSGGVLVFLSSYSLLAKLELRWKQTATWERISRHKVVLSESKSASKEGFDEGLQRFYAAVKRPKKFGNEITGALLLAISRGKVSEGLDFADDNARAVISVGIPYPAIKDLQVSVKRDYNDEYCRQRKLLTGGQWYDIQAFRALNQGLGRCIRHRHDWGAIMLIDTRFQNQPRIIERLSKWVRSSIQHSVHSGEAMTKLQAFVTERQAKMAKPTVLEGSDAAADSLDVQEIPSARERSQPARRKIRGGRQQDENGAPSVPEVAQFFRPFPAKRPRVQIAYEETDTQQTEATAHVRPGFRTSSFMDPARQSQSATEPVDLAQEPPWVMAWGSSIPAPKGASTPLASTTAVALQPVDTSSPIASRTSKNAVFAPKPTRQMALLNASDAATKSQILGQPQHMETVITDSLEDDGAQEPLIDEARSSPRPRTSVSQPQQQQREGARILHQQQPQREGARTLHQQQQQHEGTRTLHQQQQPQEEQPQISANARTAVPSVAMGESSLVEDSFEQLVAAHPSVLADHSTTTVSTASVCSESAVNRIADDDLVAFFDDSDFDD
eukprot:m.334192 g.334192  ORF g.334192 m.334192 type:complete len:1204 (-) comp55663_c0_seq1:121-3732(-)